jgi:hypothetical protein
MPWQPKPDAPAGFNLGQAFATMITGDPDWGWLLGWVPVIDNQTINTGAFCAAGPPAEPELDPSLFLTGPGDGRVKFALLLAMRIAYLKALAEYRTFAGYCELLGDQGPGYHVHLDQSGPFSPPQAGPVFWGREYRLIPAGATYVRAVYSEVTETSGNGWSGRLIVTTDQGSANRWDLPGADTTHEPTQPGPYGYGPTQLPAGGVYYRAFLVGENNVQPAGRVTVEFNVPVSTPEEFVPIAPEAPAGVVPPTSRTYTTIADLGAELDALEYKSEVLIALVRFLAGQIALPGEIDEDLLEVAPNDPIELDDANGIVVYLASLIPAVGVEFAEPQLLTRAGRIELGTADGWLPSIPIDHTPMVVTPLPVGAERVQVIVPPGMSAAVRKLYPPK